MDSPSDPRQGAAAFGGKDDSVRDGPENVVFSSSAGPVADLLPRLRACLADRFDFERELETGGMSSVVLATDRKHGRRVAIKVLREDLSGSSGARRFLREIEYAARLNHPHILPLHDSGTVDGIAYYVMPYVEGESLQTRLERERVLPVGDAVRIAIECAEALSYAHGEGVVHRDIKPANILLSEGQAVLADFGIAKALETMGTHVTGAGVAIGTPSYMSPEQATGEGSIDGRTDIYALGCVLYEMLVGEPPFTGPNARVVLSRQVAERVPSIRLAREGVSARLEAVVRKALEKDPVDRYASAHDFAEALRRAAAAGASRAVSTRRIAAGGLALGALVGVFALATLQRAPDAQAAALDPAHLAILPFTVAGVGEGLASFAESLHGRLIDGLTSIEAIRVISELGVRPYANTSLPADSIARALGVGTLIAARVEGDGDSVLVRFQFVDGTTGEQVAFRMAVAARPQRLALMDAVADTILVYLRLTLGQAVLKRSRLLETNSLPAFESFQFAGTMHREFELALASGDLGRAEASLRMSDSLFERAEQLDPLWIEPTIYRGRLAEHWVKLANRVRRDADPSPALEDGLRHAERALDRNRQSPSALYLRGRLRYLLWKDSREPEVLAGAEQDLRAALSGNPRRAEVHRTLMELLIDLGRNEEALVEGERGFELDPYFALAPVFYLRLFEASFTLAQDTTASRWCRRGAREYPAQTMFHHCQLRLLAWGQVEPQPPDSAWALLERIVAGFPPSVRSHLTPGFLVDVAAVLARAGAPDSARAVLARVQERGVNNEHDAATQAGVLLLLGESEQATALVRGYLAEHPEQRGPLSRKRELRGAQAPDELRRLLSEG